jgi:hypothetical protein
MAAPIVFSVVTDSPKQCQWCGERFARTSEKGIHVHEAHPETIGRGRTRSVPWTCGCNTQMPPHIEHCTHCGSKHWSTL